MSVLTVIIRSYPIVLTIALIANSGLAYSQSTNSGNSSNEVAASNTPTTKPRPDKLSSEAISLDLVNEYLQLGAQQLALSILSNAPPLDGGDSWDSWETKFYEVAELVEDWQSIVDRIQESGDGYPLELFKLSQSAAVRAEIELSRGSDARRRARSLIWNGPYDPQYVLKWRELVIDSYLADRMYDDAQIALAEFFRDYRPNTPQWEHRFARILLLTGQYDEAIARIEGLQTAEGRMLRLYAEYLSKTKLPAELIDALLTLQPEFENKPALAAELWAIVELLARADRHTETQVTAVENGLSIGYEPKGATQIATVVPLGSTSGLLSAYKNHAIDVGNSYGLIVGDEDSWFGQAQEFEIVAPVAARAIYSFLFFNTSRQKTRDLAVRLFAAQLVKAEHFRIFHLLFVEEQSFPLDAVSLADLNALANWEIRRRDFEAAALAFANMSGPPNETEREQWLLHRSRVSIYADDNKTASELLTELVDGLPVPMDGNMVDRIVQVVFDLQASGQDLAAIKVLNKLFEKSVEKQQKRELLHWLAESYSSLKLHRKAADLFLRSATMGENWDDDWGQSVRYRSAIELMESGLFADSRHMFNSLKELTFDPRLRAVIDERLVELNEREFGNQ